MYPQTYSFYYIERALSLAAKFLVGGVIPLTGLAVYVLTALALQTMAKRRGIACPWLAWIPVANLWLVGSLSDQYRYLTQGQVRYRRVVLLVLKVCATVLRWGMIGAAIWMFASNLSVAGMLTTLCVAVLCCGISIAQTVLYLMALYDVYSSCDPRNAAMYLILGIFFSFLKPIFLFLSRNQELGMPPRKVIPQEEPVGEI